MSAPRSIRSVGLVAHRERPLAHDLATRAAAWLDARGVEVRMLSEDSDATGLGESDAATIRQQIRRRAQGLDLAIAIGGDGTMLHTVDLVSEQGLPVLGINVWRLGYLTEVEPDELEDALSRLLSGAFEIDERMMLEILVQTSGPAAGRWWALNEAVLEKERQGHLVRLEIAVNGSFFTTYAADGIIVATPTGSTAYSFSARGPLVSPRHRCLVVTPISPHMLFDRALVLDEEEQLGITVSEGRGATLTIDGRELGPLGPGDTVTCTGGPMPARIVTFRPRDFHQILKAKFGLTDR